MLNKEAIISNISYCGLLCPLCVTDNSCSCKGDNNCGKRLSKEGCYQYNCCTKKGIDGCWQCEEAPCGKDMLAPGKVKMRAFIRCIKEDGIEKFAYYIVKGAENGIVYHRSGVIGDYDLTTEEAVLKLLRG